MNIALALWHRFKVADVVKTNMLPQQIVVCILYIEELKKLRGLALWCGKHEDLQTYIMFLLSLRNYTLTNVVFIQALYQRIEFIAPLTVCGQFFALGLHASACRWV